MKVAFSSDGRVGIVTPDEESMMDISDIVRQLVGTTCQPTESWWQRFCRLFGSVAERIGDEAPETQTTKLSEVSLQAPVVQPSKIVGAAANYAAHVEEMKPIQERVAGKYESWLLDFDVFLKAPSSIVGPRSRVRLPHVGEKAHEVHHEVELAVVIGTGGLAIRSDSAFEHVLGYTIGLDMTLRGSGDRSRRKSYDTFTPLGPWLTTADEVEDPHELTISLTVGGDVRQQGTTRDMVVKIPELIEHISSIMRLEPGDVILTGTPPGVGGVEAGEKVVASIWGLGTLEVEVSDTRVEENLS